MDVDLNRYSMRGVACTPLVKVVRQRSPQLAQIRFLRFRTCESPLHGSQTPETLFTAHSWCVHAPVARSAPSELRDRAILSLFWCFPLLIKVTYPKGFSMGFGWYFWDDKRFGGFCFRKNALTFFWSRIFGQDFFLTYALCDFLSTEHVFESTPAFRNALSRYLLGGATVPLAPPLRRSLTDHLKERSFIL